MNHQRMAIPTHPDLKPHGDRLRHLVELCKSELQAEQVWLFGSRARGDHGPNSDWDVLVVLPDAAPEDCDDPARVFGVRRQSGLLCDLLTVRASDFRTARDVMNTLSHTVVREGFRLDVDAPASES